MVLIIPKYDYTVVPAHHSPEPRAWATSDCASPPVTSKVTLEVTNRSTIFTIVVGVNPQLGESPEE